jgi:hypothetical protein
MLINREFERVPRDSEGCSAVAHRWDSETEVQVGEVGGEIRSDVAKRR